MKLGGSLNRQVLEFYFPDILTATFILFLISSLAQAEQEFTITLSTPHVANIGLMIEDMENKMRNTLNEIYFGKTKVIYLFKAFVDVKL